MADHTSLSLPEEYMQEWITDSLFTLPESHDLSTPEYSHRATNDLQVLDQLEKDESVFAAIPSKPESLSISTVFTADDVLGSGVPERPDIALCSSDSTIFYVHSSSVTHSSLGSIISSPSHTYDNAAVNVLSISENADVVNVLLHSIYRMSCLHFMPSLSVLKRALEILAPLRSHLQPSSPLCAALLALAPMHPVEVYTLAAHYDLEHIAVPTSAHLLSLDLSSLTDSMAISMGARYLKRLFFLHLGRNEALKRSLMIMPVLHSPAPGCSFDGQQKLQKLWMQCIATLAWDRKTDLAPSILEVTFKPTIGLLDCSECKSQLEIRIREMVIEWAMVKRTI